MICVQILHFERFNRSTQFYSPQEEIFEIDENKIFVHIEYTSEGCLSVFYITIVSTCTVHGYVINIYTLKFFFSLTFSPWKTHTKMEIISKISIGTLYKNFLEKKIPSLLTTQLTFRAQNKLFCSKYVITINFCIIYCIS